MSSVITSNQRREMRDQKSPEESSKDTTHNTQVETVKLRMILLRYSRLVIFLSCLASPTVITAGNDIDKSNIPNRNLRFLTNNKEEEETTQSCSSLRKKCTTGNTCKLDVCATVQCNKGLHDVCIPNPCKSCSAICCSAVDEEEKNHLLTIYS